MEKSTPKRERPPQFTGWLSTDDEEITRRKWRGKTEISAISVIDDKFLPYCDYQVVSANGHTYTVEWRSADSRINSCDCADFLTNRLGTCKHIEGVNEFISNDRKSDHRNSENPRLEIFIDETNSRKLQVAWPRTGSGLTSDLKAAIEDSVSKLPRGSSSALEALNAIAAKNPGLMRVSRRLSSWNDAKLLARRKIESRNRFAKGLKSGDHSLNFLKHELLPYQVDGVLHLAFGERVLLADDMGLGKTVQAIAACALLKERRGVERVLVVSPASLKSEWEEQIMKFSELPSKSVFGNPAARRIAYSSQTFFTLCNYEQILSDGRVIMSLFQPDVIILDEAQRIKNWRTKTAAAIKRLRSRYAFVLTGTPLENRIDEVYSIVQFLDPDLLGPLFRFNRDFYDLDDRGRPVGYSNLEELNRRISSVMLRRRKQDVEKELPSRTDKTYFVPMTQDQMDFYGDFEASAARIAAKGRRRPLTPDEFKQLQLCLACMRMACDTPAILDNAKRYECPKLDEIEKLFPELLEDPERKIVVFSEWITMLELVRDYAVDAGWEFAWHTGSVPQQRRRLEIKRFRDDPECRMFLSSESGGVGLNLQVADTVVNLDQPWNPARLEQRISRAWRKFQTRPVTVINLVSEGTIEHRMLGLLQDKRAVADGVIDGEGDLSQIKMPGGRKAFLDRVSQVLGDESPKPPAEERAKSSLDRLVNTLIESCGEALKNIFIRGEEAALCVIDIPPEQIEEKEKHLRSLTELSLNVINLATYESLHRLAQTGMMSLPTADMQEIYPTSEVRQPKRNEHLDKAIELIERADHKLKAALLLDGGGFREEASAPAKDAACIAISALAVLRGQSEMDSAETAAEYLIEEGLRKDTPHGVVPLLMDGAFDGEVTEVVKRTVDWTRQEIASSSDR